MAGIDGPVWSRSPGAASKVRAGVLPLLVFWALAGCGASEPTTPAVTDWVFFLETVGDRERYLLVQEDGTYESAVLYEHRTRAGTLTDAQIDQLKDLTSEAQFDVYLEESAPDCEAVDIDVAVQTVRWREPANGVLHERGGCWVRMKVESEETQTFLDTISELQQILAE